MYNRMNEKPGHLTGRDTVDTSLIFRTIIALFLANFYQILLHYIPSLLFDADRRRFIVLMRISLQMT